jgi:hypothetical protein
VRDVDGDEDLHGWVGPGQHPGFPQDDVLAFGGEWFPDRLRVEGPLRSPVDVGTRALVAVRAEVSADTGGKVAVDVGVQIVVEAGVQMGV